VIVFGLAQIWHSSKGKYMGRNSKRQREKI